ncbi:MAG TPA: thioredoxin family protein [Pseudonocardiaceae bacterium]|nr:thioredoxin family protein [Pseudonocardiaceae bacterium]
MPRIELTKENFADVVSGAEMTLIDFEGPRCGRCRAFGPVFAQVSQHHPDTVFGTVDTEAQPELAAMFRVMSLPTLVILREGLMLYCKPGALPLEDLEELVNGARALDLDKVRRKRAARRSEAAPNRAAPQSRRLRAVNPQPEYSAGHGQIT